MSNQDNTKGFTFPGFLVRVFLYSSVLITLLLPFQNFDSDCFLCFRLDNARKAKEAEARTYINNINRAQKNYYIEKGKLILNLPDLNLGIEQDSENYSYRILTPMQSQESELKQVVIVAQSKKRNLNSYLGAIVIITEASTDDGKMEDGHILAVSCEIKPYQPLPTKLPRVANNKLICPPGYNKL